MSLIDVSRVINNLVALGVILGIGFMIWSSMDKEKTRETIAGLKRLFGKIGGKNE